MPTFNTTDPKPGYVYDAAIDTWFPLVGIAPGSSISRWRKTAAGSETSVSGLDDLGATLSYNAGTEQVYLNGVLLVRTEDYLATNGTSVTGLTALAANDVIEVISFDATNVQITDALLETDINAKGDLIVGAAVDTAAILSSGTNGQVLKVNTATATGLEWGTVDADIEGVTAGTGISGGGTSGTVTITNSMATAIDAKGDLIPGTGADTFARLAVGANNTVLTADSATETGLKWVAPAPTGKVLQVVQATSNTATTVTSTTVYGDLGLSVSITPSSATSKILIMVSQSIYSSRASAGSVGYAVQIVRNSTPVFTPAVNNFGSGYIAYSGASGNWGINNMLNMNYLDSPNTTSAITYKTQGYTQSSVIGQFESAGSTIIAMEIAE